MSSPNKPAKGEHWDGRTRDRGRVRRNVIRAMKAEGATYLTIGKALGVSGQAAREIDTRPLRPFDIFGGDA